MTNKHHEWEDQWREAFDGAEAPPSPRVWKNIESELAVQESGKYRRGFLFYRTIAATLLLLIAGLSWYILTRQDGTDTSPLSADEPTQPDEPRARGANPLTSPSTDELALSEAGEEAADEAENKEQQASAEAPRPGQTVASTTEQNTNEPVHTKHSDETKAQDHLATRSPLAIAEHQEAKRNASTIATVASQGIAGLSLALPPSLAETEKLYRVPQLMAVSQKKDKTSQPLFFAGLTLAPGYFDPQFQVAGGSPLNSLDLGGPSSAPGFFNEDRQANRSLVPPSSSGIENSPELSFTYGIDVGMKLSEHWVLESGIDYNRFSTSTETRWQVADVASGNQYAYVAANRYALSQTSSPALTTITPVNNAYEFIAVPMQIGYQVAVSKFYLRVSSGVAANFFLGNVISASSGQLEDFRISDSKGDSPFNAVYYSGVLSGGVNYNILGNYFLSLTPSYTFALTQLTKESSNIGSQPYSFGVNVGFQYQF